MSDLDESSMLRHSVVKLFTVVKRPDHFHPWEFEYQDNSGGTACVIEGERLLTNAHVVTHQLHVQAMKPGDSRKYNARVTSIDHDRELAILSVDDASFFAGTRPVSLGPLPPQNARVKAFGFPVGGNELAVTTGVVSRIEVISYAHSRRSLLAIQTDAALNPGNSGGPVFINDRLVGIAFQGKRNADTNKISYVIPAPIIEDFLTDVQDGAIQGVPDLGIYWQKIENKYLRSWAGAAVDGGILVSRVIHGSTADGLLASGDVLISIDDTSVASDGAVRLSEDHRVNFSYLVSRKQVRETSRLRVLRGSTLLELEAQLKPFNTLVPSRPGAFPEYVVFCGMVFTTLTWEYMSCWPWDKLDFRLKYYEACRFPDASRSRIVILSQVLAHGINVGYHKMRGMLVQSINGVKISSLADVPSALDRPIGPFHVIDVDNPGPRTDSSDFHAAFGTKIVLPVVEAAQAHAEILERHGIAPSKASRLGE